MIKKSAYLFVCLPLVLAACDDMKGTPSHLLDNAEDNTSSVWHKAREYLGVGHKKSNTPKENTQPGFCYKSYVDITCYSQPVPSFEEDRLTGYQTRSGKTGYVLYHPTHVKKREVEEKEDKKTEGQTDKKADKKKTHKKAKVKAKEHKEEKKESAPDKEAQKSTPETATPTPAADTTPASTAASTPAPTPTTPSATTPAANSPAVAPAEKKKPEKQLKEIIFDPAELEPKELVPQKQQ